MKLRNVFIYMKLKLDLFFNILKGKLLYSINSGAKPPLKVSNNCCMILTHTLSIIERLQQRILNMIET